LGRLREPGIKGRPTTKTLIYRYIPPTTGRAARVKMNCRKQAGHLDGFRIHFTEV
jgi:hypothetical protein